LKAGQSFIMKYITDILIILNFLALARLINAKALEVLSRARRKTSKGKGK